MGMKRGARPTAAQGGIQNLEDRMQNGPGEYQGDKEYERMHERGVSMLYARDAIFSRDWRTYGEGEHRRRAGHSGSEYRDTKKTRGASGERD